MRTIHCDSIVAYIRKHGSITQMEATEHIGCTRLAARIADLKKKGYVIGSEMVKGTNRHGDPVTYKKYWIKEEVAC